jgi:hypothetical protein
MTVHHIFLGNRRYEDATVMHFMPSLKYDSSLETIYDTVRVNLTTGLVAEEAYRAYAQSSTSGYYYIENDSIRLNCKYYNAMSPAPEIDLIFATLYRQ